MCMSFSPYSSEDIARVKGLTPSISTCFGYDLQTRTSQQKSIEDQAWLLVDGPLEEAPKPKVQVAALRSSSYPLMLLPSRSWRFRGKASRPWTIAGHYAGLGKRADVVLFDQVKDYMPPLYWAGRFQSRFDQWRTGAMRVELDPLYQVSGLPEPCKLSQESAAACQIFLQLRDLCMSNQAADSLWVNSAVLTFDNTH
jgi:hypothetical protein